MPTRSAGRLLAALGPVAGLAAGVVVVGRLYVARYGTPAVWNELLDELDLRGDERVLDIGDGHSPLVRLAAGRLPRGRVVGVDPTGEGGLPFPRETFDVVVSDIAFHAVVAGGETALREAVRVLRAGGRLRVVDVRAGRYAEGLRAAGCVDVTVRRLGWRKLLSARKPPRQVVSTS